MLTIPSVLRTIPPIRIKIAAATRISTMNTPAARLVSFAVAAPPAPAADSTASRSPSAGLNAVPIAPHHPDRDHCPSSLSTDPNAQRHVEGAIHPRAINSPPKSPLRSTLCSPSVPAARVLNTTQRLDCDEEGSMSMQGQWRGPRARARSAGGAARTNPSASR